MAQKAAAAVLVFALGTAAAVSVANAPADPPIGSTTTEPQTVFVTITTHASYQGKSVHWWATRAVRARREANSSHQHLRALRSRVTTSWHPTVAYGIRLASRVFNVPEAKMWAVAHCESTLNPFAANGRYHGLFQLGWSPFGFSAFDPVASALSTAQTVVHDGGWRQWECG